MPEETDNSTILKKSLYPIKMIIPPMKTRMIYFRTEASQLKWVALLSEQTDNRSLFDFYTMDTDVLGQG
jgi:hypothetical protein